jgi:hypothetical protein
MVFSSHLFVFYFLPLLVYYLLPLRGKHISLKWPRQTEPAPC